MKIHNIRFRLLVILLSLTLLVAACAGQNNVVDILTNGDEDANTNTNVDANNNMEENANEANAVDEAANNADTANASSDESAPVNPPPAPALELLPVERQEISIVTEDGRALEGYYYPAAINPAPVIVMMHWAPGTYEDWQAIAPWLQNRGNAEPRMQVLDCGGQPFDFVIGPWLDESWFPVLPPDASFGLVVFNFGGCGNSEGGTGREAYLLDATAAVLKASTLEGVDPFMISTIGASIGADGAPDGCLLFNQAVAAGEAEGQCLGAFSLSPGDYLTLDYGEVVEDLQALDPAVPVTCLASEGDGSAPGTCNEGEGESFAEFIYQGSAHGMKLVDPDLTPKDPESELNALEIYLEFLEILSGMELVE